MLSRPLFSGFGFGTLLGLLLLAAAPCQAASSASVVADLKAKAEAGDDIAQYNLGLVYADPEEPIADATEAFVWLTLAVEKGSNDLVLRKLLERLAPAQLVEAKRRLEARRTTLAQTRALATSPIQPAASNAAERSPFVTPIATPRADTSALELELAQLRADKKQLSGELAAAWKETEGAKSASISKVAELNQTIATLQAQLAAKSASQPGKDLSAELETRSLALKRAEEGKEQIARDLATLSAEATSLRSQLAAEQRARADLAAKSLAAQESTGKSGAEIEALRRSLADASTALRAEQTQKGALAAQLKAAQDEKLELQQQLKATADRIQSASAAPTQQLASLRDALAEAKAESQRLQTELAKAQQTATASRQQAASSEAVVLLQSQLEQTQQSLRSVEGERDALKQKLAAVPAASLSGETVEGLTRQLTDSENKLTTALRSYTLLREELDAAKKQVGDLEAEKSSLASKVEVAQAERSTLSNELASKSVAAGEAESLRAQLQSANSELLALRATTAQLTPAANEAATLREQLRQTQQQGAAAALEVSQLRTRLALLAPASSGSLATPTRPGSQSVSFAAPPPPAVTETKVGPTSASAAGATASAAPAASSSASRVHVVQTGDTLSRIATKYYGDAKRWSDIVEANRDRIANPDRLVVGTSLRIP